MQDSVEQLQIEIDHQENISTKHIEESKATNLRKYKQS